jgi:hypothetical protein
MVSSLGGLMAEWKFLPPTVDEGLQGVQRLFQFYKLTRGISIVLNPSTGTYQQIRYPLDSTLPDYPQVYRGGYEYTVDDATKAALIAANVGVTESNFTEL